MLLYFWTVQVFSNIVVVTVSGAAKEWWFASEGLAPVMTAFCRAWTCGARPFPRAPFRPLSVGRPPAFARALSHALGDLTPQVARGHSQVRPRRHLLRLADRRHHPDGLRDRHLPRGEGEEA